MYDPYKHLTFTQALKRANQHHQFKPIILDGVFLATGELLSRDLDVYRCAQCGVEKGVIRGPLQPNEIAVFGPSSFEVCPKRKG